MAKCKIPRLGDGGEVFIFTDQILGLANALNSILHQNKDSDLRSRFILLIINLHFNKYHLLNLIYVLGLLEVELKDVQNSPVQVDNGSWDQRRCENLSNHTIGVLKLNRNLKLSSQF